MHWPCVFPLQTCQSSSDACQMPHSWCTGQRAGNSNNRPLLNCGLMLGQSPNGDGLIEFTTLQIHLLWSYNMFLSTIIPHESLWIHNVPLASYIQRSPTLHGQSQGPPSQRHREYQHRIASFRCGTRFPAPGGHDATSSAWNLRCWNLLGFQIVALERTGIHFTKVFLWTKRSTYIWTKGWRLHLFGHRGSCYHIFFHSGWHIRNHQSIKARSAFEAREPVEHSDGVQHVHPCAAGDEVWKGTMEQLLV